MAGTKRKRREARPDELPEAWHWGLALSSDPALFGGEAQRRAAWFKYRHLIEVNPCHRAACWWHFESPEPRNPAEPEHEQLERMGCLTPEERGHLAQWRAAGIFPTKGTER